MNTTNVSPKLNVAAIRQWIRLLRSGEFRQTQGQLRIGKNPRTYKHCCLGVACELYSTVKTGFFNDNSFVVDFDDAGVWEGADLGHAGVKGFQFFPIAETSVLPLRVRRWLGLGQYAEDRLISHNDNGKTFEEIANMLEAALRYQRQHGTAPDAAWWDINYPRID